MTNYSGVSRILSSYLGQENGSETAKTPDNFGADIFIDDFEDEFPMGDSADTEGWTPESRRANEGRPWGGKFGDRPKVHEVNQPVKAQERGWRLLDLHPNRNHKEEYYRLAGTPAELRILLQLVRATREMVGKNINFEEWFEQWEKGFPDAKEQRNGNFLLTGDKQWDRIKKPESRPRFKEWTTSQQRIDWGFRVIEYWRDRSSEGSSVLLTGTDLQLINQIVQYEWQSESNSIIIPGKNSKPLLKGWPAIILKFYELNDNTRRKPTGEPRSRVEGQKMIRCVGYSDDVEVVKRGLGELIGSVDIRRWARKIREEFASPELYRWQKGRGCLSYSGQIARLQGLEGYALVKTAQQGKELFEKLLRIFDFTPDSAGFKYSTNEAPEIAFPQNPPNFQLLGKEWAAETHRPDSTVVFDNAVLCLPKLRSPIPLVKGDKVVYKDV